MSVCEIFINYKNVQNGRIASVVDVTIKFLTTISKDI